MVTVHQSVGALGIVAVDVVAADHPGAVGHHCDVGTVLQDVAFCDPEGVAASADYSDPMLTPLVARDVEHIAGFDAADIREAGAGTEIVIVIDIADKVCAVGCTALAAVGGELRSLVVAPGDAVLPASVVDEVVHLGGGVVSGNRNRIGSEPDNAGVIGLACVLAEAADLIVGSGIQGVVELFAFANFVPGRAGSEGAVLGDDVFRMGCPGTTLGADLSSTLRNRNSGRVLDREVEPASGLTNVRNLRASDGRHGRRQRGCGQTEDRSDDHSHDKDKFGESLHK